MLRTDCIRLVGTTCSRSDVVINLVTRCLTTCSRLDTTTGNKQCERILISACRQPCYNLLAGLEQCARFYVCSIRMVDALSCRTRVHDPCTYHKRSDWSIPACRFTVSQTHRYFGRKSRLKLAKFGCNLLPITD